MFWPAIAVIGLIVGAVMSWQGLVSGRQPLQRPDPLLQWREKPVRRWREDWSWTFIAAHAATIAMLTLLLVMSLRVSTPAPRVVANSAEASAPQAPPTPCTPKASSESS